MSFLIDDAVGAWVPHGRFVIEGAAQGPPKEVQTPDERTKLFYEVRLYLESTSSRMRAIAVRAVPASASVGSARRGRASEMRSRFAGRSQPAR